MPSQLIHIDLLVSSVRGTKAQADKSDNRQKTVVFLPRSFASSIPHIKGSRTINILKGVINTTKKQKYTFGFEVKPDAPGQFATAFYMQDKYLIVKLFILCYNHP